MGKIRNFKDNLKIAGLSLIVVGLADICVIEKVIINYQLEVLHVFYSMEVIHKHDPLPQ